MRDRADFNDLMASIHPSVLGYITNFEYFRGVMELAYNDPRRTYHNLRHIVEMLQAHYHMMGSQAPYFAEVSVAILFHDIVYDVRPAYPGANEDFSSEAADRCNCFDVEGINWDVVRRLILATKHTGTLTDPLEQYIADLDLRSMASEWPKFSQINEWVIREYINGGFTRLDVLKGRHSFFKSMLAKDTVFYNWPVGNAIARSNIHKAITELEFEIDELRVRST